MSWCTSVENLSARVSVMKQAILTLIIFLYANNASYLLRLQCGVSRRVSRSNLQRLLQWKGLLCFFIWGNNRNSLHLLFVTQTIMKFEVTSMKGFMFLSRNKYKSVGLTLNCSVMSFVNELWTWNCLSDYYSLVSWAKEQGKVVVVEGPWGRQGVHLESEQ